SLIATSTVRFGARRFGSSFRARSELMPGMWSCDSSSSCQLRGGSLIRTAGASETDSAGGGSVAGADAAGLAGTGAVATVAGAPHAAAVKARRMNDPDHDFMDVPRKGLLNHN